MRCSSGQRSDHGVKVDASANIAKFNNENNCSCVNNESSFRPSINNNSSNSNNHNNVCCPTVEGEGEVRGELQQKQQPEANEIESGATSAATATLTLTATAADKFCDCVAQRQTTTTTTVKTMRAGAANRNALLRKTARDCNDDVACAAIKAAAVSLTYRI